MIGAQSQHCLKLSVKFSELVMVWDGLSSAGVGPLGFLKNTFDPTKILATLKSSMLSFDKLYTDSTFIFH